MRPSTTRDAQGGLTSSLPTFVFDAWCELKSKTVSELFTASQLESLVLFTATFRERRDIHAGDLLRYQGTGGERELRVEASAVIDERGVWTVCTCSQDGQNVVGHCD